MIISLTLHVVVRHAFLTQAPVLQPLPASDVKLDCWYMDDTDEDQRKPHRQSPNVPATAEELEKVGVVSWRLNADDPENDPALAAIRKVRHCLLTCRNRRRASIFHKRKTIRHFV